MVSHPPADETYEVLIVRYACARRFQFRHTIEESEIDHLRVVHEQGCTANTSEGPALLVPGYDPAVLDRHLRLDGPMGEFATVIGDVSGRVRIHDGACDAGKDR